MSNNIDSKNGDSLTIIREMLYEMHHKWANDPNEDGHYKSNEGYIGVVLNYPNWFEAGDYLTDKPEVSLEIYSYLFGPHRLHEFDSFEEAITEVKKWYKQYMGQEYEDK